MEDRNFKIVCGKELHDKFQKMFHDELNKQFETQLMWGIKPEPFKWKMPESTIYEYHKRFLERTLEFIDIIDESKWEGL